MAYSFNTTEQVITPQSQELSSEQLKRQAESFITEIQKIFQKSGPLKDATRRRDFGEMVGGKANLREHILEFGQAAAGKSWVLSLTDPRETHWRKIVVQVGEAYPYDKSVIAYEEIERPKPGYPATKKISNKNDPVAVEGVRNFLSQLKELSGASLKVAASST